MHTHYIYLYTGLLYLIIFKYLAIFFSPIYSVANFDIIQYIYIYIYKKIESK